jgi:hypothetical protein
MDKSTEWVNKKKLKCNDIVENYKNIEMFQNIYNDGTGPLESNEPIIEGAKFNIFDELNMHKKRDSFKIPNVDRLKAGFDAIKEFILCPFYKSDQIIDKGIQSLLSVFLAVGCNDLSLNLFQKKGDTEILDLNDLIDPNLLYTEEFTPSDNSNNGPIDSSTNAPDENVVEDFVPGMVIVNNEWSKSKEKSSKKYSKTKKSANTFASKFKMDCHAQKETARQNIRKYSGKIRNEIYNILLIPLVIHVLYNLYYM